MESWIWQNWPAVVMPVVVFVATLIILVWLRGRLYNALRRLLYRLGWEDERRLAQALRIPSLIWSVVLAVSLGALVSSIPLEWKEIISRSLWTVFIISLAFSIGTLTGSLLLLYGRRLHLPRNAIIVSRNVNRGIITLVALLGLLEIWGIPTSPILFLIAIVVLVAALAFRDTVPNFFAGLQIGATEHIKIGDYIKLNGEQGYVTEVGWTNTRIQGLDQSIIIIPNSRLVKNTVINYGRPVKKAREPFQFNGRAHLKEITGLRAKNLTELVTHLKTVPEAVVYYHTHNFVEEHHYLTPEPSNDFAVWVNDALGYEVLGERLAAVDTFEFANLGALRERLVNILEDYLASRPNLREAMEGREFYFVKALSVIFPTQYVAHDLREFLENLRKISLGSLYFHIFESRLRLGRGMNDFSIWLRDSLGESELADEIARLDPYTYTLEGLRSSLVRLIEKRVR